jgi:hypothetical protein
MVVLQEFQRNRGFEFLHPDDRTLYARSVVSDASFSYSVVYEEPGVVTLTVKQIAGSGEQMGGMIRMIRELVREFVPVLEEVGWS